MSLSSSLLSTTTLLSSSCHCYWCYHSIATTATATTSTVIANTTAFAKLQILHCYCFCCLLPHTMPEPEPSRTTSTALAIAAIASTAFATHHSYCCHNCLLPLALAPKIDSYYFYHDYHSYITILIPLPHQLLLLGVPPAQSSYCCCYHLNNCLAALAFIFCYYWLPQLLLQLSARGRTTTAIANIAATCQLFLPPQRYHYQH